VTIQRLSGLKYSQHLKVTTYSSAVIRCVCPNKAVRARLDLNRGHTRKSIRGKSAVRMREAADRLPHSRVQLTHDLRPRRGQTAACVYLSADLYCKHQYTTAIIQCGQNLRGPFLRATLPMRVGSCARAMVDNGETKELITPSPK